ncbi:MAG: DNA mismatch repair endonuclease MutL, partial [Planctomycetota bacterium]
MTAMQEASSSPPQEASAVAPRLAAAGGAIQPLPPHVVNQIAAGEVVERPASVVRELLDNALDAGATRIRVELEGGGARLVRVLDDGCGIGPEDLPLALAPHATSKIRAAEDLARIQTLGFRGEALASIASVSRLTIRSRRREDPCAHALSQEGERPGAVKPASGPVGTCVTVRDLFFNAPARRAFLRTTATEQARCLEVVRDAAAAHPLVGFVCLCDGRAALDLPPGQSLPERTAALLGEALAQETVEVSLEAEQSGGVTVWGRVGLPATARPSARWQRIFVNGRRVRDATVQHALAEAYRGLIEPVKKPVATLFLEVNPAEVDVNVHPAKAEVRFHDPGKIHAATLRAVREALSREDLTTSWRPRGSAAAAAPGPSAPAPEPQQRRSAAGGGFVLQTSPAEAQGGFDYEALRDAVERDRDAQTAPTTSAPQQLTAPKPASPALQVHNSFLVTQDETGVVIIDQHALHERVMFEKLRERISQGPLESQRLLTPVTLQAHPDKVAQLERLAPLLARLGIEADPAGPETVAVHAVPTLLFDRGVDAGAFVEDLLDKADEFLEDEEEALREILDTMACKAAVKAGEKLSEEQIAELLAFRDRVERASNCPHGRPTTIRLTIRE